jgi:archaeal flagellar protein FlaJ
MYADRAPPVEWKRADAGGETVTPKAKVPPASDRFLRSYRAFCYRLLGRRMELATGSEELSERLKQAGLNVTPGLHYSVVLITTLIAAVSSFVAGLIIFGLIIHVSLFLAWVGLVVLVTTATTFGAFGFMISSSIANRKSRLERELPFTLSELSVLASTGMSPIELVRRMARRTHDAEMTDEFRKVVYKADIQGKDLITALAETAKESASQSLREALWDLANMIHQGGNLDEYLRNKSDDVMKLKRTIQKEFIERLQTFVDMYVSLVLVGVLMIAVGAFLLNAFGSTAAGLDANELLLLLTYGIVPLAVIMTSLMISIAYGKAQ